MSRLLTALCLLLTGCLGYTGPFVVDGVDLREMGPVMDRLFTQVGPMEFALCLDGEQTGPGQWRVTKVILPFQHGNDSTRVAFVCGGHPGIAHNHPILGGKWANRPVCWPSPVDAAVLREKYEFAVTWCEPGRFFALSKASPP